MKPVCSNRHSNRRLQSDSYHHDFRKQFQSEGDEQFQSDSVFDLLEFSQPKGNLEFFDLLEFSQPKGNIGM